MDNTVIDMDKITNETKAKLRDFNEQEAYFQLCEIFAFAQSTGNFARFQQDLNEWKKRYPIDLFSDDLKYKIKYMLSKEFLETVLKGFLAFEALSKKDPSKGLEKLRKIFEKAEVHKDEKKLDKDLNTLYKEYPLKYLKEKYPHVVPKLVSESNRNRVLGIDDIDLSNGDVIPLEFQKNISLISKDAFYDFSNIVQANSGDVEALFDWICKYKQYINGFDPSVKQSIVSTLMNRFGGELSPTDFRIPEMETNANGLLSRDEYISMGSIKKASVLQFLGILSSNNELTHDDIYKLGVIEQNNEKANIIKDSTIDYDLFCFMENKLEDELEFDEENALYLSSKPNNSTGGGTSVSLSKQDKEEKEPVQRTPFNIAHTSKKKENEKTKNTKIDFQRQIDDDYER